MRIDKSTSTDDLFKYETDAEMTSTVKDETMPAKARGRRKLRTAKVLKVYSMRTRNGRVRFKIRMLPDREMLTADEATVLEERKGLQRWLQKMRIKSLRKFEATIRHHPNFKQVLKEGRTH